MDSLNTILNSGTYGENVSRHNDNNSKIKQAITTLENVAIANKGYFDTLASLQAAFPSPKAGNIAYVANVASSTGYYIYNVVSGVWTATSTEAPAVGVEISNYAQHGYSSSPKTLKQVDDEVVQLAGETAKLTDLYSQKQAGAINNPSSSNNSYIAVNKEIKSTGTITRIRFRAVEVGALHIVVLRRLSYNYENPTGGNIEQFEEVHKEEVEITSTGINDVNVNIPFAEGSYIGVDGIAGIKVSWQASAVSQYGWWQKTGTMNMVYQPIDINLEFFYRENKFTSKEDVINIIDSKNKEVKYTTITATRNVDNYNSIRDIIKSISDADEYNRYIVFVPKGRWFEVDIQGKDFVEVVGEDMFETVLYCDGNDTENILPDDYYYASERGKVIANVDSSYLHVAFGIDNTNYTNLTLEQTKGKYAAHLDNIAFKEISFKNVRFLSLSGTSYPVGIGLRGGQILNFHECIFEREISTTFHINGKLGIFFHNWNNQNSPCELNVINSKFINCGYAMIDELGSMYQDKANFLNCSTSDIGQFTFMVDIASGKSLWTNPQTGEKEPDPKQVPYNIILNATGTKIDLIVDRSASNFLAPYNTGTQRPNWADYIISDYWGWAIVEEGVNILKGQVLSFGSTQESNVNTPAAAPFSGFTGAPILGVALSDSDSGKVKYVPVGKYAEALVNGNISSGDLAKKMTWDSGTEKLISSPTADIRDLVGFALASKASGDYGYVKIK